MLKTNSKKAKINIQAYITNNFSPENYGLETIPTSFKDIATFIHKCFYDEKIKFDERHMSYQELFREWASGLPSILDTCYYYNRSAKNDLMQILEETETESERFTESAAEQLLTDLIYREIINASEFSF